MHTECPKEGIPIFKCRIFLTTVMRVIRNRSEDCINSNRGQLEGRGLSTNCIQ